MSARTLRVAKAVRSAIADHAARTYPAECCGFLVGERVGAASRATAAWPMVNELSGVAAGAAYRIPPAVYWEAGNRAGRLGLDLVGVYHSHPDRPARPSRADIHGAWSEFVYLILGMSGDRPARFDAWRVAPDRSRFLPAALGFSDGGPR